MTTRPSAPNAETRYDFTIYCPVEKSLLSILRRFVSQVAEEMGFAGDDVLKIEMAVDEACSNIVFHAYADRAQDSRPGFELNLGMESEALTIRIQDRGKGGWPEQFQGASSLEDYRRLGREEYRGLGMLIMNDFMDEFEVTAEPEAGTVVMMRKFLRGKAAGAASGGAHRQADITTADGEQDGRG